MGSVQPRSTFGFAGPAQKLADVDYHGSLRITGTDLYSIPVATGAVGLGAFTASTIGPSWAAISPATISSRVQAIEEMFQWYVIRKLRIVYTPTCPTSTAGGLSLGYSTDWQMQNAFVGPNAQQVMELNPALFTPVWQSSSIEMKDEGTKLFECYLSSESGDNRFQGILGSQITGGAQNTTYGRLFLEYVIDFYQPSPLLSTVDIAKRRRAHAPFFTSHIDEGKEEKKSEPEWDLSDPPPPQFQPTPSSVPGGKLFLSDPPPPTPLKRLSQK
jgi:hypothetical protein